MKRALLLLLLSGTAQAGLVTAPAGWQLDPEQATKLASKTNEVSHFGGAPSLATAEVYIAPKPGVVLFVTAVAAKVTTERDAAARVAVDELHATSQRAALAGSGIAEDGWQEKVDTKAKQIEAVLAWRDTGAGTASNARMLIVADAENLIGVTAECMAGAGAEAPLVEACKAALATLDPGIDPAKRVDVALAPPGAQPTTSPQRAPAQLGDGTRVPMPPITVPQEQRQTDRRPVYVGAGIVVLAAAFWWNRRRRARFEKETNDG